jgi:hypothetical protein
MLNDDVAMQLRVAGTKEECTPANDLRTNRKSRKTKTKVSLMSWPCKLLHSGVHRMHRSHLRSAND